MAKPSKTTGPLFLALGILSNAVVIFANGRTMPVVGMPALFHAASPIWRAANPSDHLLALADHASMGFFSVGDFCLMAGALVLAFQFVKSKRKLLLRRLWSDEGQDVAEYAVMLAVILVIVIATVKMIGSSANNTFSNVASAIGSQ
jgi:Flp pilus assembly pilin Flp